MAHPLGQELQQPEEPSRRDAVAQRADQGLPQGGIAFGIEGFVLGGRALTACSSAAACLLKRRLPTTMERTFCSSSAFQSTYSRTSGWSASRVTMRAARRVVPPLLTAEAERSPTLQEGKQARRRPLPR